MIRRDVFQAIADPTRREIIRVVAYQSMNLNAVAGTFDISRQAVAQHIQVLKDCGLIVVRKQGRERFCEARLDKLSEVTDWVEQHTKIWRERFSNLNSFLDELKNESADEK